MYRTLIVLLRLQNDPTSLGSSVKTTPSLNGSYMKWGYRGNREAATSQHKEITNNHFKANGRVCKCHLASG